MISSKLNSTTAIAAALALLAGCGAASADGYDAPSGDLMVSRTVFPNNFDGVTAGVTQLPPGCVAPNCVTAKAGSSYPLVFNNDTADGSFGLTSAIYLDLYAGGARRAGSIEVPNSSQYSLFVGADQMVTSFPSKSELALNLSADERNVTFNGYLAPVGALDVSNSNTPGVFDPTNPVPSSYYRLVAKLDASGHFTFTKTNAYSGNNPRASVLENVGGLNEYLLSGNAGNGGNPQPNGVILGAGAQYVKPSTAPLSVQTDPGQPTPVGSFNITELGDKADKVGKDTNFRGLTVFNNVVYYTKGSGGNGVNTVYFIDTSGFDTLGHPKACPKGVGVPAPGAKLPSGPMTYQPAVLQTLGVYPYNMCILAGFPTTLAKTATAFPFGLFFANATTLYVADEGDGTNAFASGLYTGAAASTTAGLQKWIFNPQTGQWALAYVLQAGLDLGHRYSLAGYPQGNNPLTGLPWAPGTDGLRNIAGEVGSDGMATIYAISSTVSGGGDQGADPNKLFVIRDRVSATTLPQGEAFSLFQAAKAGEALRGVVVVPNGEFESAFGNNGAGSSN